MREVAFVRQNADTWDEFEKTIQSANPDPDRLADLYLRLTDDLAYAQTYFPDSKTTAYLNDLSTEVHQRIYKTKPLRRHRLKRFWLEDVPAEVRGAKTELIVSLSVFVGFILVGLLSAAYDDTFVRLILGDRYVNMTISNIESGDPMAVYKGAHQVDMFLGIALNNIMVSITAFAYGLFFSVGTGYILMQNGIMIGAFHYLFVKYDLLVESLLVIYIHGMLELSAIVIAGAAGFVLGNGFLFPGTLTRRESFVRAGRKGATILVSLIPVFLLAAFLEGFVTRLTDMPVAMSLLVIGGSAAFILAYYVALPFWLLAPEQDDDPGRAEAPSLSDLAPVGASVSRVKRR
jgi:uncharacterized membrane protein SpoIIM required for sporulation